MDKKIEYFAKLAYILLLFVYSTKSWEFNYWNGFCLFGSDHIGSHIRFDKISIKKNYIQRLGNLNLPNGPIYHIWFKLLKGESNDTSLTSVHKFKVLNYEL